MNGRYQSIHSLRSHWTLVGYKTTLSPLDPRNSHIPHQQWPFGAGICWSLHWYVISLPALSAHDGPAPFGKIPLLITYVYIAGLGIGQTVVVAPVYLSEIAPKSVRGLCTCTFSGSVYLGIMLAYFASWGSQLHIKEGTSNQWVSRWSSRKKNISRHVKSS